MERTAIAFYASSGHSRGTPTVKNMDTIPSHTGSLLRGHRMGKPSTGQIFESLHSVFRALSVVATLVLLTGNAVVAEEKEAQSLESTPSLKINQYEKKADLEYCDNEGDAGLCDLFLPQRSVAKGDDPEGSETGDDDPEDASKNVLSPVILLVHGGGWMSGSKWSMNRHASKLAARGFACLTINYRHAPKHKFPAQVDDLRSALVWIHDHAETYGFDVNRIGMFGYSAGGHLVSLVATLADEPWQRVSRTTEWEKDDSRWQRMPTIKAVCSGGTPTEFGYLSENSRALAFLFGGTPAEKPEVYLAAAPLEHVSPTDPAFELLHGKEDKLVLPSGTESFHTALKEAGVRTSMTLLPKCGHFLAFISPKMTSTMMAFFDSQLLDDEPNESSQ